MAIYSGVYHLSELMKEDKINKVKKKFLDGLIHESDAKEELQRLGVTIRNINKFIESSDWYEHDNESYY